MNLLDTTCACGMLMGLGNKGKLGNVVMSGDPWVREMKTLIFFV